MKNDGFNVQKCIVILLAMGTLNATSLAGIGHSTGWNVMPTDASMTFTNAYHQCRKALRVKEEVGLCLLRNGSACHADAPVWRFSFYDPTSNSCIWVEWENGLFDTNGMARLSKFSRDTAHLESDFTFDEVLLLMERKGFDLGKIIYAEFCCGGKVDRRNKLIVGMRDCVELEIDCMAETVVESESSKRENWKWSHIKECVLQQERFAYYDTRKGMALKDIILDLFARSFGRLFIEWEPPRPELECCFSRKLLESGLLEKSVELSVGDCTRWEAFEALSKKVPVKFRVEKSSLIVTLAKGDDGNLDEMERICPWGAEKKRLKGSGTPRQAWLNNHDEGNMNHKQTEM